MNSTSILERPQGEESGVGTRSRKQLWDLSFLKRTSGFSSKCLQGLCDSWAATLRINLGGLANLRGANPWTSRAAPDPRVRQAAPPGHKFLKLLTRDSSHTRFHFRDYLTFVAL